MDCSAMQRDVDDYLRTRAFSVSLSFDQMGSSRALSVLRIVRNPPLDIRLDLSISFDFFLPLCFFH